MIDFKHVLPLLAAIAACLVLTGALIGTAQKIISRHFPPLMESAYFIAACALLLWAVR